MNVPNAFTLLRIFLVPLFVGLILYEYRLSALAVFLVAGLTDALDGMIARWLGQQTRLGQYLDPLADKVLLVAGFMVLAYMGVVPVWVALVVVSRDVVISVGTLILHLLRERVDITPSWAGKATTVTQLAFIFLVLVESTGFVPLWMGTPLLVATVALTIASGIHYVYRGVALLSHPEESHR